MIISERDVEVLDEEWLSLIWEAKEIGLSIDDIRDFFKQNVLK